ncbi:MAG: 4-hydroxy-3-methylbut-2-enyl diphosphate reductase [Planctomycetes bacterium]|nr:4-hydroxy-3-methylbut-2-enyl diphosphate reductase [Planctomycetota bacterium]
MRVIVADTAGFCMGVRRALGLVLEAAEKAPAGLCTYGPLIHNNQVVEMLKRQGIDVINDPSEAADRRVVLRAHGIAVEELENFRRQGLEIIDATCPKVQRSERFVEKKAEARVPVIIVGDSGHAEVRALSSRAGDEVFVIATPEEAEAVRVPRAPALVAQTTFNEERYAAITEILRRRYPDMEILDSICSATHERQAEVREMTRCVEAIVVVGGHHSANTKRLVEIAGESGLPAFHVETADEIPAEKLRSLKTVGVTAGASTPGWATVAVVDRLRRMGGFAWLAWFRLLAFDSAIMVSALGTAAAALNQYLCGGYWSAGLVYVFCFMLSSYNLNRYFTGRRPYHTDRAGVEKLWVGATILAFLAAAVAAGLSIPPWRWHVKALVLAGAVGPLYSFIAYRIRIGRLHIERIPYAKDISVGVAWLYSASVVQWAYLGNMRAGEAALAGSATFLVGVIQSLVGDARNLDTDRLLGRDTLAGLLGKRRVVLALLAGGIVLAGLLATALSLHWK